MYPNRRQSEVRHSCRSTAQCRFLLVPKMLRSCWLGGRAVTVEKSPFQLKIPPDSGLVGQMGLHRRQLSTGQEVEHLFHYTICLVSLKEKLGMS
jgi:hypothetical protein